jgi:protein transport protein SEC39
MASTGKLSAAHVILLATRLCSDANIEAFRSLRAHYPDVLSEEAVYRIILTFLPEETEPALYRPLLKDSRNEDGQFTSALDTSPVHELSEESARAQVQQLHLRQVLPFDSNHNTKEDLRSNFLLQRAHQVDTATGDLLAILQLVEPFVDDSELLRNWLISTLLPLLRKDYEYYPDNSARLSLNEMEGLRGSGGVEILLQHAKKNPIDSAIGRDLRGIVGPWKYGGNQSKRRKVSHEDDIQSKNSSGRMDDGDNWQDVNEWIISTSQLDHTLASRVVVEWDGPQDVDLGGYDSQTPSDLGGGLTLRYCQAALATIYAAEGTSEQVELDCRRILHRVQVLSRLEQPPDHDPTKFLPDIPPLPPSVVESSRAALLHNALLQSDNELTTPSIGVLNFMNGVLSSLRALHDLHNPLSPRAVIEMCLFSTEERQQQELQKILQQAARSSGSNADWRSIREQVRWLRFWETEPRKSKSVPDGFSHRSLFWKVGTQYFERAFLGALLTAGQHQTAVDIYLSSGNGPLDLEEVENCVRESILGSYDNASNGNRTRGGMKRASEALKAFQSHFPQSSSIHKLEYLIAATHALSFYHLTLQHGVPFRPVSIRVHQDPLSLLEKVLEQNSKAYTKLDDLLFIGRNLVAAGLPTPSKGASRAADSETLESKTFDAEHRITYLAITSALSSNDFDTAYSYILTRLSPSTGPKSSAFVDDSSWRAAYAAGRHRPPSSPQTLALRIADLSKRMELLSLALTLAPTPEPLSEILGTWRRCEEEMNSLRSQEAEQEQAWDDRGDGTIPGGFAPEGRDVDIAETRREIEKRASSRRAGGYEDEAPVGLFDVARGAARAIGKSAFPLRGGQRPLHIQDHGIGLENEAQSGSDDHRVRKRDVVSNMVTGGLKSGLGWVLGAQPLDTDKE